MVTLFWYLQLRRYNMGSARSPGFRMQRSSSHLFEAESDQRGSEKADCWQHAQNVSSQWWQQQGNRG